MAGSAAAAPSPVSSYSPRLCPRGAFSLVGGVPVAAAAYLYSGPTPGRRHGRRSAARRTRYSTPPPTAPGGCRCPLPQSGDSSQASGVTAGHRPRARRPRP
jgi:hypothetical protein